MTGGRALFKEVGSATYHERKYTKLLGSIPRDAVEILPHLQGYETTPHVPFNLRSEKKTAGLSKTGIQKCRTAGKLHCLLPAASIAFYQGKQLSDFHQQKK